MHFKNTTTRAKAIKTKGGHAIVAPGETKEIDCKPTADQVAMYEKAGVQMSDKPFPVEDDAHAAELAKAEEEAKRKAEEEAAKKANAGKTGGN